MTNHDIMEALGGVDDKLLLPILNEAEGKPRRMKTAARIAIVIAAALLLLITAAIAVGSDGFFSELFGESYDIIGDYVMMEPVSTENEFARLTVESALSDGFNAYVIFSIERLDGGVMEGMAPELEIMPGYDLGWGFMPGSATREEFVTGNETPQKKWYLWCRSGDTGLEGVRLRLLGVKNMDTTERVDFGELKLEAPLKISPVKLAEPGGDPMGRDVLTRIILSPIGLRIDAWPNLAPLSTDGSGESQRNNDNRQIDCTVVLLYKDGTETDISELLERRMDGLKDCIRAGFERPVDIDQIEAMIINGARHELEYGEPEALRTSEKDSRGLKMYREYVYGEHEPLYPKISATGEKRGLAVESIWTDGSTVELFLYADTMGEQWSLQYIYTYIDNGLLELRAYDKKGEQLAIAAEVINGSMITDRGLLSSYIIHIGGKAETLTVALEGTELSIPLDMKTLSRMSQGEPYTEPPRESPAGKADEYDAYQTHYDSLFDWRTPDKVDIYADNGEYSITIEYLWQSVTKGTGKFLAMVRCERLDGEDYDWSFVPGRRELEVGVMLDGEYRAAESVSGGLGNGWREGNLFYREAEIEYQFRSGERDTVRLTWTPPSGERISIDIPVE